MIRKLTYSVVFIIMSGIAVLAFSYARGPRNARTGAPGEQTCVASDCHNDYEINSGLGELSLIGVPDTYEPDMEYPITVRLEQEGQERWGFQVTVLNESLQRSGEITAFDERSEQLETDEVDGNERYYLKHTRRGTHQGDAGPVEWEFTWTSPDSVEGPVTFYAAGNAANGDREPTGDYIYTISVQTKPAVGE